MKNDQVKDKRICFAASSGGHLEQLLVLKDLMGEFDSFLLTEKIDYEVKAPVEIEYVCQVNRSELSFLINLAKVSVKSLSIYFRHRPNIVITTGVLATIPISLFVKLFGGTLIYIESFAKSDSPTLSGKLLYRFADRFYVQWESMSRFYPKAIYIGEIY